LKALKLSALKVSHCSWLTFGSSGVMVASVEMKTPMGRGASV
jgi:hypothetical protein